MDDRVDDKILALCRARGDRESICPSEVAKALAPAGSDWRPLLGRVRMRALALARAGAIEVLRKGRPVRALDEVRGVIRLRIAAAPSSRGGSGSS